MIIECPICEDRFDLPDLVESGKISCPTCQRQFTPPRHTLTAANSKAPPPFGSARSQENLTPAGPSVPPPQRPLARRLAGDPSLPIDEKINTKSVAVIRHHRSIRRLRPWLVGLVTLGLLGVAAVLTLLILNAIQSSNWVSVEQAELDLINQELMDAAQAEAEKSAKLALGPEISRSTVVDAGLREKIIPIPQPPSKIIRSGRLDDCWMRVRPFIVKLTAQTPLGPKSLTGTIIDSRGWVATSYRAIQGAGEIEVSQSPKTSDDLNSSSLLTDKVRGIIATDFEHDLAILSVNRRFVVSFSDLPMIEQDHLVISEYLVQCVAPTGQYPWSATECRIDN